MTQLSTTLTPQVLVPSSAAGMRARLPSSPHRQPVPEPSISKLRQAVRFARDPYAFLADVRAECGDLFAIYLPGLGRIVFLCSARLLDEMYRMGEEKIDAGEIRKKIVGYLMGPRSSLSIDGEEYIRRRKLMAPHFMGQGIARHAETVRHLTEQAALRWRWGREFSLLPVFEEITCATMCRILYGPFDQGANAELLRLSKRFLAAYRSPAVLIPPLQVNLGRMSPWGRFIAARSALRQALHRDLQRRELAVWTQGEPRPAESLVSDLLTARLDDDEVTARETIVQEVFNLLIGGGGTTATATAWTFAGLLENRRALERLQAEIDDVLGDRPIEAPDLLRMPYLDAVLQEGMRYQPVAPFAGPRQAKTDVEIGGFPIAAGTVLMQCFSEVSRGEVFANPDEFDPGNFFEHDVRARDWMPFGGGHRVCTGKDLARLEMAVMVVTILRNVGLELGSGPLRPRRCGVVYPPKNGLRVRLV